MTISSGGRLVVSTLHPGIGWGHHTKYLFVRLAHFVFIAGLQIVSQQLFSNLKHVLKI